MRKSVWIGVGVLLIVLGVLFALQGLGLVAGSAMSSVTLWAVLGPIIAVIGLALLVVGLRQPARR